MEGQELLVVGVGVVGPQSVETRQECGSMMAAIVLAEGQMTGASACGEGLNGISLVCSVRTPCSNVISEGLIHFPINVKKSFKFF